MNLWNGKITILFNIFGSITLMCSCGLKSDLFQ